MRAAKDKAKAQTRRESGVERILAPVVSAALLLTALIQTQREQQHAETSATPPPPPPKQPSGIKAKLARVPVLRTLMPIQDRYGELNGNNLAATVAFQTFLSLFPLLLVIVAVVGFFASKDATVGTRIVGNLGLQGDAARIVNDAIGTAAKNPAATGPIGLVGLLWSGLGLVDSLQFAMDQVWQVEARGMKGKLFGLLWLTGAAVLFIGAAAITTVLNWLPGFITPFGVAVGLLVNLALWLWSFKVLPNRKLPWRALVPGAVVGALGMEILKFVGAFYLPRTIASSSALYGSIGVVFAVLAWLLVFSRLVIYATVINVVRWEKRVGTTTRTIEVPIRRVEDQNAAA
ncbi:MAG TPA: YihY/virulence factor BrkB family protein [Acidimicrobiales bacterium]|nr:YihY/virulence factor BrkB family protein [Acidimicrobiales bacterium]